MPGHSLALFIVKIKIRHGKEKLSLANKAIVHDKWGGSGGRNNIINNLIIRHMANEMPKSLSILIYFILYNFVCLNLISLFVFVLGFV